jgi:hypothetical protein
MSTKKLNIDILARDKSKQALNQVQGNLEKTKNSVLNLRNALVGLGVGVAIKGFVDVGKEVESLQVRFKFLFGSLEEGQTAFDNLTKFAGKVPFSLAEISRASGNLAVVSKDAKDLNRVLEITGNVAAVTGLDFETTSSQIQRAFAGGIGAADLFRERGVRALLGFQNGAKVTAEETVKRFEELFSGEGQFANATKDLATTLEGTISMIGDKYFGFQKRVSQEFFDELKGEFKALDSFFAENEKQINVLAEAIGKSLATAITTLADGVKFVNENFETFKKLGMTVAIFGLSKAFLSLAVSIGRSAVAMLSFNRKAMTNFVGLLAAAGLVLAETTGKLDQFFKMFEKPKSLQELNDEVSLLSDELELLANVSDPKFSILQNEAKTLVNELESLRETLDPLSVEFENIGFLIDQVNNSLNSLPFREILIGFEGTSQEVGFLTEKLGEFKKGFIDAMDKKTFTGFQKAGEVAFTSLTKSLTDFVITGKLDMKSFGEAVKRALVEALIGEAVQFALNKSLAMFKATSIRKALMSVYEGALATFKAIPFPFNIAAVGLAIKFGMGLVNKIKGFENGGRPPVNRPSIVGEAGPELFIPQQAGTIVPNNQLGGSVTNVSFTINAVDTRGFRSLLRNERSTIVNLINEAVTDKGRPAVI